MPSSSSKRPHDHDLSDEEQIEAGPSTNIVNGSDQQIKKSSSKKKRRSAPSPGIIFISRVPPGMTPHKIKHLMSRWGEVGKVYAQSRDAPSGYNPNHNTDKQKRKKHTSANYSEAWVEFLDKSVAKTVADMLNAEVIGGKKGDRWRDDIWTMRYLSGFKWEMLGEQVAYERQAHQARLRNEITRSKSEQGEYLRNVELARVLDKRRAKKSEQEAKQGTEAKEDGSSGQVGPSKGKEGKDSRKYRQRQAVDKEGMKEKSMEDVLGSVFG